MTSPRRKQQLKLGASGLANIANSEPDNDFAFLVGDRSYNCPWFIAAFLSPRIAQLHSNDPTMNEFVIETEDCEDEFGAFLSIGRGESVEVDEGNLRFLFSVARELGNFELSFSLQEVLQTTVPISGFAEHFKSLELGEDLSESAIEFLSIHFFEFEKSFLKYLPISVLCGILSHRSLRVESEDWLVKFIMSEIDSIGNAVLLLEFVRFEFLKKSTIDSFIDWSFDHFDDLDLTISLWRSLTRRLSEGLKVGSCPTERWVGKRFDPVEGSGLDGIIAHLSRKHGGNVHVGGIVHVSSSSVLSTNPCHAVQNVVDLVNHTASFFNSKGEPNQWLRYDFKDRRIELTDYSIAAHADGWFMRSWIVEGSEDGLSWVPLDERTNNDDADSNHPIATFSVGHRMRCRFIRLRQTGKNARNNDSLILHGFEVFGSVIG
jgi:hypothetical protein